MVKESRAEMKAELMKQAEAIIDEWLEWQVENERPNLDQVEAKVLGLRQKLSEKMAQVTLEGQAAVRPVPGPVCPGCEREMRYKGMKANTISSWVGEISLRRGYYYCKHCKRGLFPPGPTT